MPCTWGRECRLGWGYNEYFEKLIPVEVELSDVKSEGWNLWECSVRSSSSADIRYWGSISLLLEASCKKLLDFGIVLDNNQYWEVNYCFYRPEQYFEGIPRCPSNCTHFVNRIRYGVRLWVQFPKTGFPGNHSAIKELFRERDFSETQKKMKCKVMINYNEIREMTLGEFMELVTELLEGKCSQYDIPVEFYYQKLDQKVRETIITNEWDFAKFLSCLYCVYRKIEIKMERAGYPYILPDLNSEERSCINIRAELNKAKRNCKFINKNDYLRMYPMLKRLFACYTDYIRCSIDHLVNIEEGRYLPRTYEEMEPWLEKLNNWFPAQINGKWINCVESFIAIPSGYEHIIKTLRATKKFSHSLIVSDDETVEPYIREENSRRIFFRFVNMEGARTDEGSGNSVLLESEYPKECTQGLRRWICMKCGEYVRIKVNLDGFQFLVCLCGSKGYDDTLLI